MSAAEATAGARRSVARRFLPPIAAFVLQRALLAAVAAGAGYAPFAASSYARWDSAFYLHIAAAGYQPIAPCPPESRYPPSDWCGNAGWFPGYSWVVGLAAKAGFPLAAAAALLSAAAQLGCLLLIWHLLDDERQWAALGIAAFFPGNVYLAAISPVSLLLLLVLVCLACCWKERYAAAAVAAAFASACYASAVLLAPVAVLWSLVRKRPGALWVAAGAVAGYALVLAVLRLQAGHWDAWFKVQAKYGYGLGLGIEALLRHLKPIVNSRYRDAKGLVTALQTLLTLSLLVPVLCRARRHLSSDRSALLAIHSAIFWIAPLSLGGSLSLQRSEALLLPVTLLAPSFPRWLQISILAAAVALSLPMAALFFRAVLV